MLVKQKIIYPVFLFYTLLCFSLALVEIYKYPGVVAEFTHVNFKCFIYLLALLAALIKKPRKYKKTFIIIASSTILFCLCISIIELLTFSNFMFSRFHINVGGAGNLASLSLIILSPYYLPDGKILKKIALLILGYWSILNLFDTLNYAGSKIVFQINRPSASYDDKMRIELGGFYDCMLVVKSNTPEDATIFIPPQADVWQMEGNEFLVMYFLYPRRIMHFEKISEAALSLKPYFIYSWGYWPGDRKMGAWPYEKIVALSGKFVNTENDFDSPLSISFDHNNMKNPETCGIVKPIFK